jgi:NAD(P)-dependent dehydrogenase (short-subunit alcohol dehydrogenase family)
VPFCSTFPREEKTMVEGMLSGKIALITGAASGIGRVAASVFVRHGAKVVIADIQEEAGEATARQIREAGGDAQFLRADVTRESDVEALVREVVARHGRLDCAFNNAGIDGPIGLTADYATESWDRVVEINLKGVWLCMRREIPQMLAQGGGAIVNMASILGAVGVSNMPAYTAAKHGVLGVTRVAALEYATKGVRINGLCPGIIRTPLIADLIQQGMLSEPEMVSLMPIGRLGRPEEIGEAAAWMCSDRASLLVGHAMFVDGGYTAR